MWCENHTRDLGAEMTKGTRIIGYVRVSTDEQGANGGGMQAQRDAIQAEADRHGWQLVNVYEDVASGKAMHNRPGLTAALDAVKHGQADALVATKLDRLSRSVLDFANLTATAQRGRWALVVLDLGLDMTTPQGEMMANVLASFAQFERRIIGQRTTEAIAAKRSSGTLKGPLGRAGWKTRPKQLIPDTVRERIISLSAAGVSRYAIAKQLNDEGVPTAAGGAQWYPSTVKRVLDAEILDALQNRALESGERSAARFVATCTPDERRVLEDAGRDDL